MAALLDGLPAIGEYMSVKATATYAGVSKQAIFGAIARGRLHPVHIAGLSYRVFLRGDVLAWHHRVPWRPTPEEMAILLDAGYKAEDFTPATPGAPVSPLNALLNASTSPTPTPTGGSAEASGAFVTPSDVLAYVQVLSQSVTNGAANVGGEVAERAMRPFAEAMRDGAQMDISALSRAASDMATHAVRPFADSMRESMAPLTDALVQALAPRPAPPAEDVVAQQMGALRVELAQLLTRMMDAIRPMVERLAAGGYVTPEDVMPFMGLVGELAAGLAGTPFFDMSPRDAPAQMPALLAQITAVNTSPTPPNTTPAPPDAGKD